jgi:glycosyltransferase involved in cell wall biosynthesis
MVGPLPPPPGGVASFLANIKVALDAEGKYEVKVVGTGGNGQSSPPLMAMMDLWQGLRSVPSVGRGAAIVHIHTSSYYSFLRSAPYALWAGRASRAKVIVHIHGGMFKEFYRDASAPVRWLVRRTLKDADTTVVTSPSWIPMIREIAGREEGVRAIPNGFDAETFYPQDRDAARRELGIRVEGRVLVTVGYLEKVKGHQDLVEVMAMLPPQFKDVRLYILGNGSLRDALASMVRDRRLDDRVLFKYEPLSSAQVARWMSASDIFVLPSLSEGSPTVMFEALGCGRPFVGTRVGGTPDVIASGDLGLLCPPSDTKALADAIASALGREWDAAKISAHAQQYSWKSIAGRLVQLYVELTPGKS